MFWNEDDDLGEFDLDYESIPSEECDDCDTTEDLLVSPCPFLKFIYGYEEMATLCDDCYLHRIEQAKLASPKL